MEALTGLLWRPWLALRGGLDWPYVLAIRGGLGWPCYVELGWPYVEALAGLTWRPGGLDWP